MSGIRGFWAMIGAGLILLAAWPAASRAQTADGEAAQDGAAFTVYAPAASPAWEKLYYLTGPKEAQKIAFLRNRRSAPLVVESGAQAKPLVFGVEHIDAATGGKTYVPVAEARWPEGATRVLCVFEIVSGPTPRVQVTALDDGLKAFPLRSARVFNATGAPLLARIAGDDGLLPPGVSPAHGYPVVGDDPAKVGSFPLAFASRAESGEGKLLYSGYGEAWPQGRVLVFVLPVPGEPMKAVQVRLLVDAPVPPKGRS